MDISDVSTLRDLWPDRQDVNILKRSHGRLFHFVARKKKKSLKYLRCLPKCFINGNEYGSTCFMRGIDQCYLLMQTHKKLMSGSGPPTFLWDVQELCEHFWVPTQLSGSYQKSIWYQIHGPNQFCWHFKPAWLCYFLSWLFLDRCEIFVH